MAVVITIWYQKRYEKKQAKLNLFYTIISHRYQYPIPRDLVVALNKIDVIFYRNKLVTEAWRRYYASLSQIPFDAGNSNNLLADLLDEMAKSL